MIRQADKKVSCLCVTEDRAAFIPWLLWCFDRQEWTNKELVIIDSSAEPLKSNRADIRVITTKSGLPVAEKRNLAIKAAHGEIITWFDDDDWQHPNKLSWLAEALSDGASYAGGNKSWFLDLYTNRCVKYHIHTRGVIFNSAGFLRDTAQSIVFKTNINKASDTYWMRDLEKHIGYTNRQVFDDKILFFWLCHKDNLSNPAKRKQFSRSLDEVKRIIGPEAWGNTDEQLTALRDRIEKGGHPLRVEDKKPKQPIRLPNTVFCSHRPQMVSESNFDKKVGSKTEPPVSLLIKATVMDAPFLNVMARHMISQARYPFAEKTIVVDRRPAFSGKYQSRHRLSDDELNLILENLAADGIVDRVLDVDMQPQHISEITGRYFSAGTDRIPCHAYTGGPIYTTLFGMEAVSSDYVLQMDADVFFYTAGVSWVKESLKIMMQDESLWLMMTHPGPPAGPSGKSLGSRNARLAKWDREHGIWHFKTATTRYFLCNKLKLHGRLRPVKMGSGIAPLELIISHALQQNNAYRGALGDLNSWHLHVWHHGKPFPQWASLLAKAIESGKYPPLQQGNYDLRLDIEKDRREWEATIQYIAEHGLDQKRVAINVLEPTTNSTSKKAECFRTRSDNPSRINKDRTLINEESLDLEDQVTVPKKESARQLSLAVIISVRGRAGQRLKNTLASLNWQSSGRPKQIVVVSLGSSPKINKELTDICAENASKLITIGDPSDPWNKPYALNVGIKATKPQIPYLMTMDADMVLAPNFLGVVLERLKRKPPTLVLCRSSDLPQDACLPEDEQILMNSFYRLQKLTSLRPEWGPGGIQAAQRSFFFDIRGYDEDLLWWGAMDRDLVQRAKIAGLKIEWVEDRTVMLHQWHPRKYSILKDTLKASQAKRAWYTNHDLVQERSTTLKRNSAGWGEHLRIEISGF